MNLSINDVNSLSVCVSVGSWLWASVILMKLPWLNKGYCSANNEGQRSAGTAASISIPTIKMMQQRVKRCPRVDGLVGGRQGVRFFNSREFSLQFMRVIPGGLY